MSLRFIFCLGALCCALSFAASASQQLPAHPDARLAPRTDGRAYSLKPAAGNSTTQATKTQRAANKVGLSTSGLMSADLGSALFIPRDKTAPNLPARSACFSINTEVFDTLSPSPDVVYSIAGFRFSEGKSYTLDLRRFEVFATGFTAVTGTANGDQPFPPDKHLLFSGSVREIPGSYVYLAVFRSSCTGYIELPQNGAPDAQRLVVCELPSAVGSNPMMVVYNEHDVPQHTDFPLCETDEDAHKKGNHFEQMLNKEILNKGKREQVKSTETLVAGISVECDYEYYLDHGSNLSRAANYAITVMGASSAIYFRDVNVRLQIPYLRLWTTTDPYTATNSSTMLTQFRTYWNTSMTSVKRVLAHMFSGVDGLGGIAYIDALCFNQWDYGISGLQNNVTFPTATYVWDVDVTSHELGHNFSSPHTHNCDWAPAIDSCYTAEDGSCFGTIIPRLGSIMSYCHLHQSGGKYLAFHPRVQTLIRSTAEATACIPKLTPSVANDLAVISFAEPTNGAAIATSATITPTAVFRNNGTANRTNLLVTCAIRTVSGTQVYTSTQTISALSAGSSTTVAFSPVSLSSTGLYEITTSISPTGDSYFFDNSLIRPFSIVSSVSGSITLDSPNTSATLAAGSSYNITWTRSGISNVFIEFSPDNGTTWQTVHSNNTTASYSWTVPPTPTTQGRIRVSDRSNSGTYDISNSAFSVTLANDIQPIEYATPVIGNSAVLPITPRVAFRNNGTSAQSNVPVRLRIVNFSNRTEVYNTTSTIVASAAGEIDTVAFSQFVTTASGVYMFYAKAMLSSDQNISNDSLLRSAAMTLPPSSLTLLSPNGGEVWQSGIQKTISWTHTGIIFNVKLEYSTNNGSTWTTIATVTPNTGSYNWVLPSLSSSQGRIRVSDVVNAVNDMSNAAFTFQPVQPPAGLIATGGNASVSLSWSPSPSSGIDSYRIYRGTTPGGLSAYISLVGNQTTYTDTMVTNCTTYYYAVSAIASSAESAQSTQATATPSAATSISVAAPNGGEQWQVGLTRTISWSFTGCISTVAIEYSTNNGVAWTSIAASAPNTGSYSWSVPNTISTRATVRITNTANGAISDMGNTLFAIVPLLPPTSLQVVTSGTSAVLSWVLSSSTITSYDVFRKTGAGPYVLIGTIPPAATSVRDTTTARNTSYTYALCSRLSTFSSDFSTPASFIYLQPTITPSGSTTFCQGGSVTLNAGSGYASYVWSNGATSQSITASASGTYRVTVASVSGYSESTVLTVTVLPLPTPTITPSSSTTFCQGGNVTLNAGAGFASYLWSNGATTQSITVSATGTYTVTIANASGCSNSTFASVTVLPTPTPTITPSGLTTFCQGANVTLNASAGFTAYLWSNGATTQSITVSATGTYTVTTANAGGCSNSTFASVTVLPTPTPTITPNGSTTFCQAGNVTLNASAGFTSYLWSNGATTQSITVSATGIYTVTTANASGCSNSTFASVTVLPTPTPTITPNGATTFCQAGNVTLNASAGFTSYLWSNGATTQSITVSATGIYTVTTANASGCSNSTFASVTVLPTPTPTITPNGATTFCQGGNVTLNASAGFASYLWSNGATTQSITVSATGTYTVTTANAGGCSNSTFASVTVLPTPTPTITPSGTTTFCQSGNVTLNAGAGFTSYLWSNGATTQSITVSATGTYTVTVANASGCSNSTFASVTVLPTPTPTITPSGSTTFCQGGNVTLNAGAGFTSYLWSNGATTQSITVSATGTYTVTTANASGCSNSTFASVTVLPTPTPTITPSGTTTFCQGGNVTLNASAGFTSYLWSNGATTQSITVSATGTYTVTTANAGGCSNSTFASVIVLPLPTPTITPSGTTTFCQGGNVTLNASAGFTSYLWSNGATTQSITVSATGTYTVTTANAGGCSNSTFASVIVLPLPTPTITPSGTTTFCQGGNVTLNASAGFTSYLWSNGATTQSITVSATGTYTVTTANASGCSNSTFALVSVLPRPTPTITPNGSTTFCQGGNVTLNAGAGFTSYLWSNGATTQSITVSATGTYTVTTANASGCSNSTFASVIVLPLPTPTITPNDATVFCQGGSITLNASAGFTSYLWSNGATTQSITVGATGTYTVTTANASGCSNSTFASVTVLPLPVARVQGPANVCSQSMGVVYTASTTASTYAWSVLGGTITSTTTGVSITVNWSGGTTGSISLTLSSTLGCSNSTTQAIAISGAPRPSITANGSTTLCEGNSITLDAGSGYTNYLWSNGATTQTIAVSEAAAYTVVVTAAGGCSGSTSLSISVQPSPSIPVITSTTPTVFCEGGSVRLVASAGYSSYLWSNGATTQTITATQSDTYTVVVSNAGGCTATSQPVAVTALSRPAVSAGVDVSICAGNSAQLTATGGTTYVWQPAAGLSNASIANPIASPDTTTTYIVTALNAAGCSASDTLTVIVQPVGVDIALFLEGPFDGTQMHTLLRQQDVIPAQQPYNTAPFNYNGSERSDSLPASVVDWVLIEFRSAADSSVVVARCAALLLSNGSVVGTNGSALHIASSVLPADNYYIVVRHRTHIAVMSATAVQLAPDCSLAHSFISSQAQAFSSFQAPMKQLAAGVFGPATGDANADGIVNAADRVAVRGSTGSLGYLVSDATLDGIVNAVDRVAVRNNTFQVSQVP